MNEQLILLSQPGKCCPVNSFKMYLSKLIEIDALFRYLTLITNIVMTDSTTPPPHPLVKILAENS